MMNPENKNDAPSDCGRKQELVAYLYDEANAVERASFERHLDDCAVCHAELKSFERVRGDLSAWQVGFSHRTELALSRRRLDAVSEFICLFPVWARGAALSAVAAALLLFAFSFAGPRINLRGGAGADALQASVNSEQIQYLIKEAVAKERAQMQDEYKAQLAGLRAEHETQMQALDAASQAKLEAVKAGLRAEIRKSNRQNSSIRSFFAMDDSQDPLGDLR